MFDALVNGQIEVDFTLLAAAVGIFTLATLAYLAGRWRRRGGLSG